MENGGKSVRDPAVTHQPSKDELGKDARIDTTPEALGWAVTRGGAMRRDSPEHHARSTGTASNS